MMPLLPGYVFCRFDRLEKSIPVVTTPGVVRVIGFGKIPEPVDQNEIGALQRIIDSGLAAEPHPFLTAGDRVRIMHGPLTGVSGTLVKVKNRHRLVLSITLLQRSVSVEIDRHWIRPE